MADEVLYAVDEMLRPWLFGALKDKIDIVCVGDSITGWNNSGSSGDWPFVTYPGLLHGIYQGLRKKLRVVNCGIAGALSSAGSALVGEGLEKFPNSQYFVIGFGANDLGMGGGVRETSEGIIDNLREMVSCVKGRGKIPLLLNVPHLDDSWFSGDVADYAREKRDYYNPRLRDYCLGNGIKLVDICSILGNGDFGDGLHPNSNGARKIAEQVFLALNSFSV